MGCGGRGSPEKNSRKTAGLSGTKAGGGVGCGERKKDIQRTSNEAVS